MVGPEEQHTRGERGGVRVVEGRASRLGQVGGQLKREAGDVLHWRRGGNESVDPSHVQVLCCKGWVKDLDHMINVVGLGSVVVGLAVACEAALPTLGI